jgi:hypothetical protein
VQLLAWILVCAVGSYASRRRPLLVVVAIVSLWVLVPSVAGDLVTGRSAGSLAFHPATWLAFTAVAAQLVHRDSQLLRVVGRHVFVVISLVLVVGVAVVTTRYGSGGGGGLVLLGDQVVGPVCLFLLVLTAARADGTTLTTLRTALLTLCAVTSAVTIAQWAAGDVLIYRAAHETVWWFNREGFDRWMGTTDHPLTLSLLLCVCLPLAAGLSRAWLQFVLLALGALAVVISQSRTGLIVLAGVAVYIVIRSRAGAGAKALLAGVMVFAAARVSSSALTQGVADRFADDTGSAEARSAAFRFFADHWTQYAFLGDGFTSSFGVAQSAGLGTSLESSVLMYAVDIGVVFAAVYFGAQLLIVMRGLTGPTMLGLRLAAVCALLLPHTYSALASGSLVGPLLWTVLAMVVAAGDRPAEAAEPVAAHPQLVGAGVPSRFVRGMADWA